MVKAEMHYLQVWNLWMARPFVCVVVVGVPDNRQNCKRCGCTRAIHGEVEVVGDGVFRAPRWSTGFLHLHFSVAGGVEYLGKTGGLYYEQRERKQNTD